MQLRTAICIEVQAEAIACSTCRIAIAPSLHAELSLSVLLFFVLALEQIVNRTQTSRYCYERVGLCKT
ncbi:MAG: hypothetical protein ICV63_16300 [Coleofasciculus sp. Co-bin14]|nr:hypothetical protein [Coleofasciculus sp. Co-bin14]